MYGWRIPRCVSLFGSSTIKTKLEDKLKKLTDINATVLAVCYYAVCEGH